MDKIKYFIFSFFLLAVFLLPQNSVAATGTVYFFYGEGCPHCAQEKIFLDDVRKKYPDMKQEHFEVWHNQANLDLLVSLGRALGADVSGVPFTLIGDRYLVGFRSAESTGADLEKMIEICRQSDCPDVVETVRAGSDWQNKKKQLDSNLSKSASIPEKLSVPFWGDLSIRSLSLPVLTVIMGALDGFNPCAMWVLIFLIGLLLRVENRKKRWILGLVFLAASAGVYYIFMAAWLNVLLVLGLVIWVRWLVGAVALAGGFFNVRDFIKNPAGACKVTRQPERKIVFEKLKKIVLERNLWLAIAGIVLLALAVNLVELVCSAGLPVVYTQILALADLSFWQYYFYILLYILVFLLDDILVFAAAMTALEIAGINSRYARYGSLIGGIIMLLVGILLLIKPEWLMFG